MSCSCTPPHPGPERPGHSSHKSCLTCGRKIDERLLEPSPFISDFFGHVEASIPSVEGEPEQTWQAFRRHCELREQAGRPTFGYRFTAKDNAAEALEEAADLALYMALEQLKLLYLGNEEEVPAVAYEAVRHAYLAYRCACDVRAKVHGSP